MSRNKSKSDKKKSNSFHDLQYSLITLPFPSAFTLFCSVVFGSGILQEAHPMKKNRYSTHNGGAGRQVQNAASSLRRNNTLFYVFVFAVAISVFWSPRIWTDPRAPQQQKFDQGTCQPSAAQRRAYQQQQNRQFSTTPEVLGNDFSCFELPGAVINLPEEALARSPQLFVSDFDSLQDDIIYEEEEDVQQQITFACPCRCQGGGVQDVQPAHDASVFLQHQNGNSFDSTYSCSIKSSRLPMQFKLDEWARSYLLSGHVNHAIIVMKKRVKKYPDKLWPHIVLGFCYERVGQFENALKSYVHAAIEFSDDEAPRDMLCQLFLQDLVMNSPRYSRSVLFDFVNLAHDTCGYPVELYEMKFENGAVVSTGTIDEFDVAVIYQDLQDMNGVHWYKERWLRVFNQWGGQALQELKKSDIGKKHIEYLDTLLSSHSAGWLGYEVLSALDFSDSEEESGYPQLIRNFEAIGTSQMTPHPTANDQTTNTEKIHFSDPLFEHEDDLEEDEEDLYPHLVNHMGNQNHLNPHLENHIFQSEPVIEISPIPCQNYGTLATSFRSGEEVEQTFLQFPDSSDSLHLEEDVENYLEDSIEGDDSEYNQFGDFDSFGIIGANPCDSSTRISSSGNYCSTDRITEKMVCLSFICGDGPKLHRFHLYNFASI